ncbi:MAG: hypothetical protein CFE22_15890 [Cytophagaceae bacterium BCCC1]|nr:MAG: hypothetical protein CFE22_15890 [Cytophagaceae bacterium BCCC1]
MTSIAFNGFAEGTKQVSPTDQKVASLYFAPTNAFGSGFNALQRNRIYFHIANNATENLYFGANLRTGGSTSTLTDVYYRIKDAAGNVVSGPTLFTSNITSHAQAVAGPSSYSPITFNPTSDGDFYIEIYRGNSGGSAQGSTTAFVAPWFDFSVGTSTTAITDGRVFCENWSFRATKPSDNFTGTFTDPVSPTLYSYTNDETVVKVEFNDFQPLSFIPAFNSYGVDPLQTDWSIGRKSINSNVSAPVLSGGYRTFLNEPDASVYPSASLAAAPTLNGNVTGCAGAYFIPYFTNVDGDVRFLLDINGTAGFQLGTTDRILEAFGVSAGSHLMPWDGLDGLGNVLSPNTTVTSQISMLRGRINLPMYDAEMNRNGFSLTAVSPVLVSNLRMYWDDASLTNHANNTTGAGVDNSALGQVSPGHGWNGTYGSTLLVPPVLPGGEGSDTPSDANDDFGNLRTINTWFWGLEEQSGTLNFRLPYCISIQGNVYSDANGLNNSLINGTGSNFGGLYAYLVNTLGNVVAIDTVNSDGTYIFNNIDSGSFTVRISTNTGVVGNPAPVIAFPTGYSTIGEGTAASGDGTPSGDTPITVVASNITGVNFGLNQLPNSNTASGTFLNPTGTNTVTVPTLGGSDPEDGSLGVTNSIIIKVLPLNGTLYYNGIAVVDEQVIASYNSALLTLDPSFPSVGTVVFDYAFFDNTGLVDPTPATVAINFTNNPPVANNDTNAPIASTAGQTAINALTATDTDGTIANYRIETLPTLGTLYVGGVAATVGQVLTPAQVATLTYDPSGTANGTDSFTFTAIDNNGAEDATDATVSIPVTNNPPVANNDTNAPIASTAGQTAINALTATDTDGTIANYRIESLPTLGTLYVGGVAATVGQVLTPAQVATLTYDPSGTANGTDSFTFTAIDNNGAEDATDATISIPVTNNPPVANNNTNAPIASTAGQTAINALTATDTDGTIANYRIESLPTMGTLYVGGVAATVGQVLTPAQVATLTYDPSGTANGTDSFTFTAIDNNGAEDATDATVSIPVNNNPPVANNNTNAPIASTAGQTAINALTATDTDGTIANYRIESLPTMGTLYVGGVAATVGQVLTPAQVATLTYDPAGTANGTDSFTFTAIDNNGAEDATDATISIPVNNIPPIALDDSDLYNAFGTNGIVNILANDTLSTGILATTLNANIDLNPATPALDNTLIVGGEGTYTYNLSNGQVTFVPEIGLTGNPAPINYVLIDNNTGQKDTASIVITYSGFPNAVNDEDLNNLPGIVGVVNALSNDTLSTGAIANTTNASIDLNPLTPTVDHILTISGQGTYQYNLTTGIVTFIPDNGLIGNPTPINYNLIELTSGFTDMATISMTYLLPVVAVNDTNTSSPVGVNVTFDIVSNDSLSNGAIATPAEVLVDINLTTPGYQDSLIVSGEGIWSYNSTTGEITFDPETGFVNDPTPISYIITEAMTGLLDTATISIMYGVPPIANSDADLINQPQTSTVINLLANDLLSNLSTATFSMVDVDLEPTALGIQTSVLVPGEGNYVYNSSNGNLTFTPSIGNYSNPTPLIYSLIEKATGLSDTARVTIQYQFSPSLELIKTNTLMGSGLVGDSVQYDFTVINTGNVPVTGITITDTKISSTPIPVTPSALAPGGTAVASRMYYLTAGDILAGEVLNSALVNGTSSNAIAVKDTSDNGDPGMPGRSNPTRLLLPLSSDVDVKLTGTIIGNCERVVGDIVTYQVKVFREDSNAGLVDVVVKDSLGVNFELVSQIATEGSFNIGTSRWSGISLASGDTATLTFQLRILTNIGGLTCVESWVDSLSRADLDSNPGNRITTEDDIARACVSVPISICTTKAETAELSTSLGYSSYQWYRNGTLISGAISPTFTATQGGSYTVIVNGSLCPNGSCCPIVVQENCPCPVEICLPIAIRKTR